MGFAIDTYSKTLVVASQIEARLALKFQLTPKFAGNFLLFDTEVSYSFKMTLNFKEITHLH